MIRLTGVKTFARTICVGGARRRVWIVLTSPRADPFGDVGAGETAGGGGGCVVVEFGLLAHRDTVVGGHRGPPTPWAPGGRRSRSSSLRLVDEDPHPVDQLAVRAAGTEEGDAERQTVHRRQRSDHDRRTGEGGDARQAQGAGAVALVLVRRQRRGVARHRRARATPAPCRRGSRRTPRRGRRRAPPAARSTCSSVIRRGGGEARRHAGTESRRAPIRSTRRATSHDSRPCRTRKASAAAVRSTPSSTTASAPRRRAACTSGHGHRIVDVAQQFGGDRQPRALARPVGAIRRGPSSARRPARAGRRSARGARRCRTIGARATTPRRVDRAVRRSPAVDAAVAGRDADRPAGVGAEGQVGEAGGHRGGRARRRAARAPVRAPEGCAASRSAGWCRRARTSARP